MNTLTEKYPLPRSFGQGMSGMDVSAAQDALLRWGKAKRPRLESGVRKIPSTGIYGAGTITQVKHFQKLHDLPQSGVVGNRTWNLLLPFMSARDLAYAQHEYAVNHPYDAREAIAKAALDAYAHRYSIQYVQIRPARWASTHTVHADELTGEDCSSLAIWTYWVAHQGDKNILDPGGFNFDGYGNTDSMINNPHGKWVHTPRMGDLAHYVNPNHDAIVTEVSSSGVIVVSNGHYPMIHQTAWYGHQFQGFRDYIHD